MPDFDHVVIGAVLSGLLLTEALCDEGLGTVLLVEPGPDAPSTTTFAYWSDQPTALDPWVLRHWDRVAVRYASGARRELPLEGLRYTAVAWDRARRDLMGWARSASCVTVLEDTVTRVESAGDAAVAHTRESLHTARVGVRRRRPSRDGGHHIGNGWGRGTGAHHDAHDEHAPGGDGQRVVERQPLRRGTSPCSTGSRRPPCSGSSTARRPASTSRGSYVPCPRHRPCAPLRESVGDSFVGGLVRPEYRILVQYLIRYP